MPAASIKPAVAAIAKSSVVGSSTIAPNMVR